METAKVIQLPVMDSLGPAADYRCLPSVPLHAAVVIVPFFYLPSLQRSDGDDQSDSTAYHGQSGTAADCHCLPSVSLHAAVVIVLSLSPQPPEILWRRPE